jgi:hypothetical protein
MSSGIVDWVAPAPVLARSGCLALALGSSMNGVQADPADTDRGGVVVLWGVG